MVFIQYKDVFANAIINQVTNLSAKMIDSISLILTLVETDASTEAKNKKAMVYANNISAYLKSSKNKTHTSYELIIAALGNKVTSGQNQFIKTLLLMDSNVVEQNISENRSRKISHSVNRELIKI